MAAEHGLDSIVATNIEDWHYEIPDGYFDNIEGMEGWKTQVLFLKIRSWRLLTLFLL